MKWVKFWLAVKLAFLVGVTVPVSFAAQPKAPHTAHYTVTDLGSLGGSLAQAGGISNTGWVEGFSLLPGDDSFHVFVWHNGVMTDIGTLGGPDSFAEYRPNDFGQAGGYSETSDPDPNGEDFCGFGTQLTCLAFTWRNGVMTALPNLGGNNGSGFGSNDLGELAGTAENTTPEPSCEGTGQIFQYEPVFWKKGSIHELPTFPGDPVGMATAINIWGQAVGVSGPCGAGNIGVNSHALLWKNGKAIDLGNLGGQMNNFPQDINAWGQIVGLSDLAGDATFHAFLWQKGTMKDLGTLPGDVHSNAESINDFGQVVGKSADANFNGRAFVWQNGVMTDLNTLIPENSTLFLLNATSNNDWGQIVGSAVDLDTGDIHAFLATPCFGNGADKEISSNVRQLQRPSISHPGSLRLLQRRSGVQDRSRSNDLYR